MFSPFKILLVRWTASPSIMVSGAHMIANEKPCPLMDGLGECSRNTSGFVIFDDGRGIVDAVCPHRPDWLFCVSLTHRRRRPVRGESRGAVVAGGIFHDAVLFILAMMVVRSPS